jgi:hypothetical protein
MLIGSSELLNYDHSLHKDRRSRVVKYYGLVTSSFSNFLQLIYNLTISRASRHNRSHNFISNFFRSLERYLDNFLNALSRSKHCKHHLCNHRYNCLIYSIMVLIYIIKSNRVSIVYVYYVIIMFSRDLYNDFVRGSYFKLSLNASGLLAQY